MSYVISIYSTQVYKKYILPEISDGSYNIHLTDEDFGFDDIEVLLDVTGNIWSFKKNRFRYSITDESGEDYIGHELKDQDDLRLYIKDDSGHTIELFVLVHERAVSFYPFLKYRIAYDANRITIGRDSGADIMYDFGDRLVSRTHAEFNRTKTGFNFINKGKNPTYINDQKIAVDSTCSLEFGDIINILGLDIVYLGDVLAIDSFIAAQTNPSVLKLSDGKDLVYSKLVEVGHSESKTIHRSPRNYDRIDESAVDIEGPPDLGQRHTPSLLMTVGPSLTMAIPMLGSCFLLSGSSGGNYMFSALFMALTSASIGAIWAYAGVNSQKKEEEEKKKQRDVAYNQYLHVKKEYLDEKYKETKRILLSKYPNVKECVCFNAKNSNLWSRNQSHSDFLTYRLGIGDIPFQIAINIPPDRFHIYKDEFASMPAALKEEYQKLFKVPVTLDLSAHRMIGVIGGKHKRGAIEIARNLIVQIAANNCYTDVKFVALYDDNSAYENNVFKELKRLPHIWSSDRKIRFLANESEEHQDVFYELTNIFRNIAESKKDQANASDMTRVYYIVFVSNQRLLKDEALGKYLMDSNKDLPIMSFFLVDSYADLPNGCDYIIQNDEKFRCMYHITDHEDEKQGIDFDDVSEKEYRNFTRNLAELRVDQIESGGELPESISFFDMYGVKRPEELNAQEKWKRAKVYNDIKGLLGQKAGEKECYLDLHEKMHGPHGLIAGTTGSGKSETLQTYMLSLSINYSPDDIGFFIIDYKGGGMAKLFEGLPHLIGQISNLSGNQVRRAMISIKSENRRRERIFAENGVNNINAYTKLYKNGEVTIPIPHLVIIIDEFAELKEAEPDFMQQLISVAQVGRSLGVHLILATQKPSGKVDPNIWSNSKFRICLRVQDQDDSKDMLHKPDAAFLTHAGRAYLQVGNDEVYELFQSGYSGAVYDETVLDENLDTVRLLRLDGKPEITGNMAKNNLKTRSQYIWIKKILECLESTNPDCGNPVNINRWYHAIWNAGLDYPESTYNTKGLNNLYHLYCEAKEETQSSGSDYVSTVLELAKSQGNTFRLPQAKEKTQLDAVISYLADVAAENEYKPAMQLWMPVLREKIYVDELKRMLAASDDGAGYEAWSFPVIIGQFDDPENQQQPVFVLDFAQAGNIAVCGSGSSGKSTFLQTMIYSVLAAYSPDQINIFAIDYSSSMLKDFTCTVVYGEDEADSIPTVFDHIKKIILQRKKKYSGRSFTDVVQAKGLVDPLVLFIIDNFARFNEETKGEYESQVIQFAKEGLKYGIHVIVTGMSFRMSDIPMQLADNLQTVVCLQLPDKTDYGILLRESRVEMPEQGIKGRGMTKYDGRILEFQTALAIETENDYDRPEMIRQFCEELETRYDFSYVDNIKGVPENLDWNEFILNNKFQKARHDEGKLPIGYDLKENAIYSIPMKDTICYMINGEDQDARVNMFRACIESAIMKENTQVCIIDSFTSPLLSEYGKDEIILESGVEYINDTEKLNIFIYGTTADELEESIPEEARERMRSFIGSDGISIPGFHKEFMDRNKYKHSLEEENLTEDQLFAKMNSEPAIYVFIVDFLEFITKYRELHPDEATRKYADRFLQSCFEKGRLHNIYFFANFSKEQTDNLKGDILFDSFAQHRSGSHLGGNLLYDDVLSFSYLPMKDKQSEKASDILRLSDYYHNLQGVGEIKILKVR